MPNCGSLCLEAAVHVGISNFHPLKWALQIFLWGLWCEKLRKHCPPWLLTIHWLNSVWPNNFFSVINRTKGMCSCPMKAVWGRSWEIFLGTNTRKFGCLLVETFWLSYPAESVSWSVRWGSWWVCLEWSKVIHASTEPELLVSDKCWINSSYYYYY